MEPEASANLDRIPVVTDMQYENLLKLTKGVDGGKFGAEVVQEPGDDGQ